MNLRININQLLNGKAVELKMTEGRSTGIRKILNAMAKNGSTKPEFEFGEEHTYFQVKLPVHGEDLKGENNDDLDLTAHVTPQVKNLLKILDRKMSRSEIMDILQLGDRKNFRILYLNPAIEHSLVELTIPDKPNSSKQKYRLTEYGKDILRRKR